MGRQEADEDGCGSPVLSKDEKENRHDADVRHQFDRMNLVIQPFSRRFIFSIKQRRPEFSSLALESG